MPSSDSSIIFYHSCLSLTKLDPSSSFTKMLQYMVSAVCILVHFFNYLGVVCVRDFSL